MKDFAALFARIDESTKTNVKLAALADYLGRATPQDRLWTIALFTGRRPKRAVTATRLRQWAAEVARLPEWLFEDSYHVVGDLAETISLVLPAPREPRDQSLSHWIATVKALATLDEAARKSAVIAAWDSLATQERFLFNKLLTGGFRMGVSARLMTRALAISTGQDVAVLTHKLMGNWTPETTSWEALIEADDPTPVAAMAQHVRALHCNLAPSARGGAKVNDPRAFCEELEPVVQFRQLERGARSVSEALRFGYVGIVQLPFEPACRRRLPTLRGFHP